MDRDVTARFDPADIAANKNMALFSYLGWLLLLPYFLKRDSAFIRFHANQGLLLACASTAVGIISKLLIEMKLLGMIGVILGGVVSLPVLIAVGIGSLYGIIAAAKGEAKKLPLVGDIHLIDDEAKQG